MAGVAAHPKTPGQVESPNGPVAPFDPEHEYAEGGHAETGHAHAHGPLHHHFDDMEQQRESTTLGMWAFMSTEVMMFGGLFFVYTLYRHLFAGAAHELNQGGSGITYADPFHVGGFLLNVPLGTANTFVLLFSSLTMAMAVHFAQLQKRKAMLGFMAATLLFGCTFLGIKAVEWTADYHEGLVPALNWEPDETLKHKGYLAVGGSGVDGTISTDSAASNQPFESGRALTTGQPAPNPETKVGASGHAAAEGGHGGQAHGSSGTPESVNTNHLQMYFVIYFCMTGLHAIHMVIGAAILITMMIMGARGAFENGNDQPVELFGLYWHFVDIVWVFLFPLLYLVGGFRL